MVDIEKIKLYASNHTKPATLDESAQACAMEWVSVLAGEPWSDSPQCACPVIAAFVRRFNDGVKDDDRRTELLRPILPLLLNTRSTRAVRERRAYLAADWAVRVVAPAWLRLAGLDALAAELADVAPIVDSATALAARDVARKVRAADACTDAAAYAGTAYAGTAAAAACTDAAAYAGTAYAGTAAAAACTDAAAYAGTAADAARKAKAAELRATLEDSAVDLVRRMVAVTEGSC